MDLLSSVGGTFGLFIGVCALTLVEFIQLLFALVGCRPAESINNFNDRRQPKLPLASPSMVGFWQKPIVPLTAVHQDGNGKLYGNVNQNYYNEMMATPQPASSSGVVNRYMYG
jgi:hypothetical protein